MKPTSYDRMYDEHYPPKPCLEKAIMEALGTENAVLFVEITRKIS